MQQGLPGKIAGAGVNNFAVATAGCAGGAANQVRALLHQQRLIAADQVDREALLLQVLAQLLGLELHYRAAA